MRSCVNELFVEGTCNVFVGLMCVLFFNVMELLPCCAGRLCARPCIVFQ